MPDSGSGTDHELPDVIITHQSGYFAGEVKYTNGDKIDVSPQRIEDLMKFSERWDFIPAVLLRYSQDTNFYFIGIGGDVYQDLVSESGWIYPKRKTRKSLPEVYDVLRGKDVRMKTKEVSE